MGPGVWGYEEDNGYPVGFHSKQPYTTLKGALEKHAPVPQYVQHVLPRNIWLASMPSLKSSIPVLGKHIPTEGAFGGLAF